MSRRHRLSSRASTNSEQVISPASSDAEAAISLALSAASLILCHSGLELWMILA